MTKQEKVVQFLINRGDREVPSRSRKYRTFERGAGSEWARYWFVGKCGALRTGPKVSDSVSVTSLIEHL